MNQWMTNFGSIHLRRKIRYVPVITKFWIALLLGGLWLGLSIYLSIDWIHDLSEVTNLFIALFIIGGVAYVPGFFNAFLVVSVLLDTQPKFKVANPREDVTILIAAYNEGERIYETLAYIEKQQYKGTIRTIVINNHSTDNTVAEVLRAKDDMSISIECVNELKQGKFHALNNGLALTDTEYVITLDADTLLHPKAINNLVARMLSAPEDIGAVAGSVLVRNSRTNILTRLQEWDYFLSIMSIKRMQGLFQGTLVAQGAFSIYKTDLIKKLGGWSDSIGEDIVLTWNMLQKKYRVYYEPTSIAFTVVPDKLKHFCRQRSRWARGMIEGLRMVKPWQQPNAYYRFLTGIDLLIPYMDFSYTVFFIPGCILALFGKYYIVGPYFLLVLPLTFITFLILFKKQKKFYDQLELKVRKNRTGFFLFLLCYQAIMSPVSLYGYMEELFHKKRVWK